MKLTLAIALVLAVGILHLANNKIQDLEEYNTAVRAELETACTLKGDMNGDKDLTIVDLSILAEHIRSLNEQKQSI